MVLGRVRCKRGEGEMYEGEVWEGEGEMWEGKRCGRKEGEM